MPTNKAFTLLDSETLEVEWKKAREAERRGEIEFEKQMTELFKSPVEYTVEQTIDFISLKINLGHPKPMLYSGRGPRSKKTQYDSAHERRKGFYHRLVRLPVSGAKGRVSTGEATLITIKTLDESAPHCHAVILPLINGKMQGRNLMGDMGNLMRLINKFHVEVARHYGLSRSDRKRLNHADKQTLEKQVLTRLKGDAAMQSSVWACLRDAIHNDPLPFAQMLSIQMPLATQGKTKLFVQIMTSKGKSSNTNAI
jgi:hypothetical protein